MHHFTVIITLRAKCHILIFCEKIYWTQYIGHECIMYFNHYIIHMVHLKNMFFHFSDIPNITCYDIP